LPVESFVASMRFRRRGRYIPFDPAASLASVALGSSVTDPARWSNASDAASSVGLRALRRTGPRPPALFLPHRAEDLRAPRANLCTAGPVDARPSPVNTPQVAFLHGIGQARPDASLEVPVPFSARSPRRVCPKLPARGRSRLDVCLTAPSPSPDAIALACRHITMHPRTASSCSPLRFYAGRSWLGRCCANQMPRVLAETLRLSRHAHPLHRDVRARAHRGSCASAFLQPAFRYPLTRVTWPGRSPFGVEAFLVSVRCSRPMTFAGGV